jgi:hypothetical protein
LKIFGIKQKISHLAVTAQLFYLLKGITFLYSERIGFVQKRQQGIVELSSRWINYFVFLITANFPSTFDRSVAPIQHIYLKDSYDCPNIVQENSTLA